MNQYLQLFNKFWTQQNSMKGYFPEELVPTKFKCSLTGIIMNVPMLASDGWNYEKLVIQSWMSRRSISPITGEPIEKICFFNRLLKREIDVFLQQNPIINVDKDRFQSEQLKNFVNRKIIQLFGGQQKQKIIQTVTQKLKDLAADGLQNQQRNSLVKEKLNNLQLLLGQQRRINAAQIADLKKENNFLNQKLKALKELADQACFLASGSAKEYSPNPEKKQNLINQSIINSDKRDKAVKIEESLDQGEQDQNGKQNLEKQVHKPQRTYKKRKQQTRNLKANHRKRDLKADFQIYQMCQNATQELTYYQGYAKHQQRLRQWEAAQQRVRDQIERTKNDGSWRQVLFQRGKYYGQILKGQKHGVGIIQTIQGEKYTGEWEEDLQNGFGKYQLFDGGQYEGFMNKGCICYKFGKYFTQNRPYKGDLYIGQFDKQGRTQGFGINQFKAGKVYIGQFFRNRCHGFGTMLSLKGNILYQGVYQSGKPIQKQQKVKRPKKNKLKIQRKPCRIRKTKGIKKQGAKNQ